MLKRGLWNFEVEIDESATADWYLTSEPWSCDCGDCRNFIELCNRNNLPEAVHAILRNIKDTHDTTSDCF